MANHQNNSEKRSITRKLYYNNTSTVLSQQILKPIPIVRYLYYHTQKSCLHYN